MLGNSYWADPIASDNFVDDTQLAGLGIGSTDRWVAAAERFSVLKFHGG
jgi:hypothetical protein